MQEYVINKKEKEVLRCLAGQVAELAARPIEMEKRDLWYRHNALEATRPVIFCDPENGWKEIVTEEQLKCENELARQWEGVLRRDIFWGTSMGDDRVVEPFFNINYDYTESDWGMHETKTGGVGGGAYHWDAPLKDYKDFDKLHFPDIKVDYQKTDLLKDLANEIFGDLLTISIKGNWWWTLGITQTLVFLRGLEQIMYDVYDYPDELHKLMSFLRDGHMHKLDFLERNSLLSLNNYGTYVGSGGFGYTTELPQKDFDKNKVRTIDMWGFGESQETSQISPDMFEEFIFPYQLTILQRFGLNCYGCCEALNKRWHIIEKIPNLRRISVSPWADLKDMAEKLGDRYVYSMKPNPAYLAVSNIDEELIRKGLREAMKVTKGCRVEVIMKDNNTIGKNPENVIRWCKIAREEAENL
jgi:hypothetical protein